MPKPATWAARLVRAYARIGKRVTEREARVELDACYAAGMSAGYVVTTAEAIKLRHRRGKQ